MRIDGPQPMFVYRAFDQADQLLYVGMTSNVRLRLGQHAAQQLWWEDVERVATEMFESRSEALEAERRAIVDEQPRYNVTHSNVNAPAPAVDRRSRGMVPDGATVVHAAVERSGNWWAASVPNVPGAFAQSMQLDQLAAEVADAVGLILGVGPESVHVELRFDDQLTELLGGLDAARTEAQETQERLSQLSRAVAVRLVSDEDLPLRDVGRMMGVSHQRVAQLLS